MRFIWDSIEGCLHNIDVNPIKKITPINVDCLRNYEFVRNEYYISDKVSGDFALAVELKDGTKVSLYDLEEDGKIISGEEESYDIYLKYIEYLNKHIFSKGSICNYFSIKKLDEQEKKNREYWEKQCAEIQYAKDHPEEYCSLLDVLKNDMAKSEEEEFEKFSKENRGEE